MENAILAFWGEVSGKEGIPSLMEQTEREMPRVHSINKDRSLEMPTFVKLVAAKVKF